MKADYFVIVGGDGLASCPLDMWRTLTGQDAVGVPYSVSPMVFITQPFPLFRRQWSLRMAERGQRERRCVQSEREDVCSHKRRKTE